MKDLLSLQTYLDANTGIWRSMGLRAGVLFGLGMGTFSALFWTFGDERALARGLGPTAGTAFLTAVIMGVFFGAFWSLLMRRMTGRFLARLYQGDVNLAPLPERPEEWEYRLLGSWASSEAMAVGGALYVGRRGVLFVPHRKNLPRHREPFLLGPPESIRVRLNVRRPNALLRLLTPAPIEPVVEVSAPDRTARFIVVNPREQAERLAALTAGARA